MDREPWEYSIPTRQMCPGHGSQSSPWSLLFSDPGHNFSLGFAASHFTFWAGCLVWHFFFFSCLLALSLWLQSSLLSLLMQKSLILVFWSVILDLIKEVPRMGQKQKAPDLNPSLGSEWLAVRPWVNYLSLRSWFPSSSTWAISPSPNPPRSWDTAMIHGWN